MKTITAIIFAVVSALLYFDSDSFGFDFSFASEAKAQSFERNCGFRWRVRRPATQDVVNGRITVKADASCKTNHIGRVGTNWQYHSVVVTKQPANGRITKVGTFGIRVVPNPGFKGTDTADITVSLKNAESGIVYPTIVRTRITVK